MWRPFNWFTPDKELSAEQLRTMTAQEIYEYMTGHKYEPTKKEEGR